MKPAAPIFSHPERSPDMLTTLAFALYFIIYPIVPRSADINPIKVAVLCLTLVLMGTWLADRRAFLRSFREFPEYRWLFAFFGYLCFSPFLGFFYDFSMVDWARDIAPLLNILTIPALANFFQKKGNRRSLYLILFVAFMGAIQGILTARSLSGIDVPEVLLEYSLPFFPPSLCLGLGLIMLLCNVRPRWVWVVFATTNLIVASLSTGRTIWIGTALVGLSTFFFASKKHISRIITISFVVILAFVSFVFLHNEDIQDSQQARFYHAVDYMGDLSIQNRVDEIIQTGQLFLSSPIYGVGFGYKYDFWRHWVTELGGAGFKDDNFTHSDIMYIASKGGIIGLFLFTVMIYKLAKRLHLIRKTAVNNNVLAWSNIALLALITSIVIGQSVPIFQFRNGSLMLAVFIGYALGTYSDAKRADPVFSRISSGSVAGRSISKNNGVSGKTWGFPHPVLHT